MFQNYLSFGYKISQVINDELYFNTYETYLLTDNTTTKQYLLSSISFLLLSKVNQFIEPKYK